MTTTQSINADVRQFIIDNFLFGQGDKLNDNESFLDAGIIDSTGVLELVGFLEQKYSFAISEAELIPENLDSVLQVSQFVGRKLNA